VLFVGVVVLGRDETDVENGDETLVGRAYPNAIVGVLWVYRSGNHAFDAVPVVEHHGRNPGTHEDDFAGVGGVSRCL